MSHEDNHPLPESQAHSPMPQVDVEQFLPKRRKPGPLDPFWKAVWRGAATVLPPLLTVVIIIWVAATVDAYIFAPLKKGIQNAIFMATADIRPAQSLPASVKSGAQEVVVGGKTFVRMRGGKYIPKEVVEYLREQLSEEEIPSQAAEAYQLYIELRYLKPHLVLPFLIALLILVLYLLGKFVTARMGRLVWSQFEALFVSLPFVRSVYGAVKQVSDFLLAQRSMEFSRVVAVEWPRRGMWSIGLVTSESFDQLRKKTGRVILSVFIPTSPAPMTGFTVNVPEEDTVDLGISIDQAIQFIVSCGVVVPPPSSQPVDLVTTSTSHDE
ncbi:MAG: DUF502 domain-containing protein [Thermogutta sp.]|uniref:DUF502 domain-containing protein n=1 Tax=Thermogutta sp. TaxID=1962930 RepID=UPI001988317B|nr:DUF502 domain-containing protein [Thermogutta sp.]MBC7352524.1 DUF502 domain-containing protein [Thermogutta sp.]